jgi:hypothetical protein
LAVYPYLSVVFREVAGVSAFGPRVPIENPCFVIGRDERWTTAEPEFRHNKSSEPDPDHSGLREILYGFSCLHSLASLAAIAAFMSARHCFSDTG